MKIFLTSIIVIMAHACYAQNQVKLSAKYLTNEKRKDTCCIMIEVNNTASTPLYYQVGVRGVVDTGTIQLSSNIESIGGTETLTLHALMPKSKIIKYLSMKKVHYLYDHYPGLKHLEFYIKCYERKSINSKEYTITHLPI